ncbi:hypothetical protein LEP1GSC125_0956 [Leptospira mayottensis 200901122]|uniref:Uncharacterized protein n=1 Tax=Leptospira mayottensis 200901122 TaxID=1193010 RepID=A0AA87T0E8_9LEPT|nr:hypothetical protein LEP1GSC125_0956 [Leptospira mayottensis 200901122]
MKIINKFEYFIFFMYFSRASFGYFKALFWDFKKGLQSLCLIFEG